jgi:hypothetical protein
LDELKTQLNKYFVHLGEYQIAFQVFVQVPCVDLETDKDEDLWKIDHHPHVIHIDDDVASMFPSMVENNKLYICVRSNCKWSN